MKAIVDKILKCEHLTERYRAVLSGDVVHFQNLCILQFLIVRPYAALAGLL